VECLFGVMAASVWESLKTSDSSVLCTRISCYVKKRLHRAQKQREQACQRPAAQGHMSWGGCTCQLGKHWGS
jgi:hypothetical protein